ncbi:MAG TPA: hypothetical protein VNU97_03150 [Rhizomicrobium sp.]|jgi:hypothetical protein|nr:hypothetical protein [Rhizomicrobium sp.]
MDAMRRGAFRSDARSTIALVAAVLAFAAAAFAPQLLNDGDTFLHIAAGGRMLADRAVLFADPFSYTFAGAPWQAHEWLAEIVMAAAYQAGGWSALVLLFACAAAAAAGLLSFSLGRWLAPAAQALVTLLALACMTGSLLARPHLLALPLLVAWTAGLVKARSERRAPSFALLPLMLVWVNVHGSFLLGFAIAAGLALDALVESPGARSRTLRDWSVFATAALGAALVNPHVIGGITFPFALMGLSSLGNVGEWQPTDFTRLQPIVPVVAAALYFLATRRVKIAPVRAAMLLGLLYMAIAHQRHQIVFAAVAPLLLAEPLSRALGRRDGVAKTWRAAIAGALAALVLLAGLRLALPLTRGDAAVAPMRALASVPAALRRQPVLNDYSFGGYLIFSGVRPFIDSRAELYGEAALARYAALIRPDAAALDTALRRYKIRWSILTPASPIVGELAARAGWHTLYADRYAVVQFRDSAAP